MQIRETRHVGPYRSDHRLPRGRRHGDSDSDGRGLLLIALADDGEQLAEALHVQTNVALEEDNALPRSQAGVVAAFEGLCEQGAAERILELDREEGGIQGQVQAAVRA